MIGIGAGLGHYTTEGGYLYPGARTVQIDTNPRGLWQGLRTADLHVRADAKAAAEAIVARLKARGISRSGFRSADMAKQIAGDSPDTKEFQVQPNTVDPRKAIVELDQAIPKDWDIVVGGGHYFSIAMTHMKGRPADKYHVVNEFGAIGSGLPAAIGIAAARGDGKVMLIEGDGSLLMHVQELETIRRQGIRMLISVMNDGGYGAEFHKFRANGIDPGEAMHGRGDLAGVATGFGLRGAAVTQMGRFAPLVPRTPGRQHRLGVGYPYRRPDPVTRLSPRALRRGLRGEDDHDIAAPCNCRPGVGGPAGRAGAGPGRRCPRHAVDAGGERGDRRAQQRVLRALRPAGRPYPFDPGHHARRQAGRAAPSAAGIGDRRPVRAGRHPSRRRLQAALGSAHHGGRRAHKGRHSLHGEGPAVTQGIMEYLQKLGERAGLGGWDSWSVPYRVLAIVAAALLAYWLLRVAVPAAVRLVRPVLLLLLAVSRHLGGLPQRDVLDAVGVQAAGALRA